MLDLGLRQSFGLIERQHLEMTIGRARPKKRSSQHPSDGLTENQAINPPRGAEGRNGKAPSEIAKPWFDGTEIGRVIVGDAGHPDTIEPALQYGGKAEPPCGKNEHQGVGREQVVDVAANGRRVERRPVVTLAFGGGEGRRKAGLVEIFDKNVVAGGGQGLNRRLGHGMAKTVAKGMGNDDEAPQGSRGISRYRTDRRHLAAPRAIGAG